MTTYPVNVPDGTTCEKSSDTQFFLFVSGCLVFFMQAGFASLEAGSVGSSSVVNILFKNMMDVFVGALVWFAWGYAFAYGHKPDLIDTDDNSFIGNHGFFLIGISACDYTYFFFQWTFAATAATIVSGAMAGRTKLIAYLIYTFFLVGFIYPVVVYWTWSNNSWLTRGNDSKDPEQKVGFYDFAGSSIVHMVGGMAALIGAIKVGPRGTANFEQYDNKYEIPGHSMPLVAIGTFTLIFGFFGFNGGSVLANDSVEDSWQVGLATVNTFLAASGGGLGAVIIHRFHQIKAGKTPFWSLMVACNGSIAGMVAICAGASTVWPWAAWLIGIGGGASYLLWSSMLHKYKIDDAIDAVGVHYGAGLWGVMAQPIFAFRTGILYRGMYYQAWEFFAWNLAGALTISAWTGVMCFIMFTLLAKYNLLRVPDEALEKGLDLDEHGESAYVFGSSSNNGGSITPSEMREAVKGSNTNTFATSVI